MSCSCWPAPESPHRASRQEKGASRRQTHFPARPPRARVRLPLPVRSSRLAPRRQAAPFRHHFHEHALQARHSCVHAECTRYRPDIRAPYTQYRSYCVHSMRKPSTVPGSWAGRASSNLGVASRILRVKLQLSSLTSGWSCDGADTPGGCRGGGGGSGARFRCSEGCDFDLCQACRDVKEAPHGVANV